MAEISPQFEETVVNHRHVKRNEASPFTTIVSNDVLERAEGGERKRQSERERERVRKKATKDDDRERV